MPSFVVVVVHVGGDGCFRIVITGKLKSFDNFALEVAMERFDVGVFLMGGHVGEFLVDIQGTQIMAHLVGDKLRAVVVAQYDALQGMRQVHSPDHLQKIQLSDAPLKDPVQDASGIDVHQGEQVIVFAIALYPDVLDIPTEVFHGACGFDPAKPDKVALTGCPDDLGLCKLNCVRF